MYLLGTIFSRGCKHIQCFYSWLKINYSPCSQYNPYPSKLNSTCPCSLFIAGFDLFMGFIVNKENTEEDHQLCPFIKIAKKNSFHNCY